MSMGPTATSKTSSQGGISNEQKMLAQYQFGEGVIGDNANLTTRGNVGMGPGTAMTQMAGGERFKEAQMAAKMSDDDYKAMLAYNQQQINSMESIAGQAGGLLGSLGGMGGGGGGGVG